MLDERDLQAIKGIVKEEIQKSEERTKEEIQKSEERTIALMEAYFNPKFELLVDKMDLIAEKVQYHEERISRVEMLNGIFN